MRGFGFIDAERHAGSGERGAGSGLEALPLFSLFGFAVAQPLLDLLGRYPQFFVARGAGRVEALSLVAVLSLGLPAAAWALIRLCAAVRPALGSWVFRGTMALGAALIVLLALKRIPGLDGGFLWLYAALLGGVVFAFAHARWKPLRMFMRILSPSPLVFAAVFVAGTPMRTFWSSGAPAQPAVTVASPAPVVMVVFDELPLGTLLNEAGELDARRFPNFANLAREANWYRKATTVADSTTLSVPAILTGLYPKSVRGRLATSADFPRNLFTLLAAQYDQRVFESASKLCPTSICTPVRGGWAGRVGSLAVDVSVLYLHLVSPPGLERRLPRVDQTWRDFVRFADLPAAAGGSPLEDFSLFLDSIRPGPRPTLSFIHLQLPHVPWVFLPSGKQYLPWKIDYTSPDVWDDQRALVEIGFQRHVLQVMLADRLLGRLVEELKELGRYDETLLIVLSDHGASFRPGGDRRGVTRRSFSDIASIPLLIKAPGQRGGRVLDVNAETIDVLPSLADVIGVDLPWRTDGRSLFSATPSPRALKTTFGGSHAGGLVFSSDLSSLSVTVVCEGGAGPLKVEPGSLRAHLENVVFRDGRVLFAGWAGDVERQRIADSILVLGDGGLVFRAPAGLPRPDVEEAFPGRGLSAAGFSFEVPSVLLEGVSEIRAIAVAGERAAEVRYPRDFPWSRGLQGPVGPFSETICERQGVGPAETRLIQAWSDVGEDALWPARLVELAGASDDAGYFRFPPCGRLVGRHASELAAADSGTVAFLDDPEAFREVDPGSAFVPAAVRGALEATGGTAPRQVAVALNGVVAGLAPTFVSPEGRTRFLVPVPETALRQGSNHVAVYGVEENGCRLSPIATAGAGPGEGPGE